MRNELNQIERVELYLNGELNITDQTAFETQMATDSQLAELVGAQQLVQQAALRKAIRADVLKYGTGGGFFSKWWMALVSAGAIVLLLGGVYMYNSQEIVDSNALIVEDASSSKEGIAVGQEIASEMDNEEKIDSTLSNLGDTTSSADSLVESTVVDAKILRSSYQNKSQETFTYEEDTHCDGLKTWIAPKQQMFDVIAENGATLEGDDGTLIIVPKNAFEDENGNIIKGKVEVELVEVLNMSEMVAYNLTTMNGDKALQSGGMIYVQPRVDGKEVNISQTNPLYIEIPTDEYNADMMAWKGEVDVYGDIDWTEPKPLEKYLTKVDFENLNFLPDGFELAVSAGMPFKSYTAANDELVDSLYYSLAMDNLSVEDVEEVMKDSVILIDSIGLMADSAVMEIPNTNNLAYLIEDLKWLLSRKSIYGKGVLVGLVTDEDGKRAGNATITIVQNGRTNKKTIKTNEHGKFYIEKLEEGRFILSGSASSKSLRVSGILSDSIGELNKGDTIRLKVPLILKVKQRSLGGKFIENTDLDVSNEDDLSLGQMSSENLICYINPLSIKSIKSDDFANTFLATKEFQERIKLLHGLKNAQNLFDLYLKNLSKNLWEVDQIVTDLLQGEEKAIFQKLADQKLTNVKNDGLHQEQLSAYYNSKLKTYKEELKAEKVKYGKQSTAKIRKEQAKLNEMVSDYNAISIHSKPNNVSLVKSSSQPQKSRKSLPSKPKKVTIPKRSITRNVVSAKSSYATPWYTGGWMNIDSYLHAIANGSKEVTISDEESKSKGGRTKVYQCLNALKTIIPLTVSGWVAKAKFPKSTTAMGSKMKHTYCIGIKEENGSLFLSQEKYNPFEVDKVNLNWRPIQQDQLIEELNQLPGFNNHLINDLKRKQKILAEIQKEKEKQAELKIQREALQKEINEQKDMVAKEQAMLDEINCFIELLIAVVDKCF